MDSPRQKVQRAFDQLRELHDATEAFVKEGAYGLAYEFDSQSAEIVVKAQVLREPPEVQWSVILGEIIHDLRSALDHLAFAMAVRHSGPAPEPLPSPSPWRRIEFPIFLSEPEFDVNGHKKLWGVRPGLLTIVKELQPFKCRYGPADTDHLWIVHELSNRDKHRSLNFVGFAAGVIGTEIYHPFDQGSFVYTAALMRGPFVHDAELCRLRYTPGPPPAPNPEMMVKLHLSFDVAFAQGGPVAQGRLLFSTVDQIRGSVHRIVEGFTAEV